MRLDSRRIAVDDSGASVAAEIARPYDSRPDRGTVVILAHGAGTDMSNPLLSAVHLGLAERGLAAVKFNFPYTECGRRAPDRMPVLEACYRRVVDAVRAELRPARLVLGGKSMGGRVASHLAAQGVPCDGLAFLGYPLHPAGLPEKLRTAHLAAIRVPMLFLAGTRDRLCDLSLLRRAIAGLRGPVEVVVIEDADHSFAVPKRARRASPVEAELVCACARWIENL